MKILNLKENPIYKTIFWILTNVLSSVGLIITNKMLMSSPNNFIYVFTLTSIHYFFNGLIMEFCAFSNLFDRKSLPIKTSIIMSILCSLSIGLTNSSLKLNQLDFYQLIKIFSIPYLVLIQLIIYKKIIS
ncbi:hypothetical protein I4U23_027134 [Adineta vaga]|nr:hypothetical protein I4U23_027134 [Adineta vaga]